MPINYTFNDVFTSGNITAHSGIFDHLSVSGIPVSVSGHIHSSSEITDFASSVSGLLPVTDILGGSNITVSQSGSVFTVAVTGSLGLTPEEVDDRVGGLLIEGSYIDLYYDDDNNLLTISATGLQPSGNYSLVGHSHSASDITDFNISVSGLIPEEVLEYDSPSNFPISGNITTIYISKDLSRAYQWTGSEYAEVGPGSNIVPNHFHTSSDITDFDSAVSGLLPVKDIVSGTGISITSNSGVYTINSTGSGVLADQAKSLVTTVFNDTGSPIPKMTAVYLDGGQGDRPTVSLALATSDPTSAGTYGLTYETIPNMDEGKVIVFGALTGLNTNQFSPNPPHVDVNGTTLYLSPTIPGGLTTTKPSAPNHMVVIGTIVRTHQNEGVIEVRIQNGYELDELHNVAISGATSGQFLQYNSSSGLWIPSSSGNFSTLLVNGTGVSLNGHTHASSNITDFSSAVSGLLPVTDLVAGSGIVITPSGSVFTINSTGGGGSGADEIEEYAATTNFPASGDLNILYRTTDDGRLYQWSGNEYAELGPDNVTTGYHAYQHASNGLDPVLNVVSRPASLSGNVNNYAHNNADILYIDSSASYNITGLVSSSDGSVKLIINKSAFTLILTHQDTNSDPSNRFLVPFGSNYNLLAGYGITIVYDSDAARWRVLA